MEPETPPRRRRRGRDDHDPHEAGSGGDTGAALLASVRRLLLSDSPAAEEGAGDEEQGQFPKRWAIVFLCFSAFLLCNMDRVRVTAWVLLSLLSAFLTLLRIDCLHGSASAPQLIKPVGCML